MKSDNVTVLKSAPPLYRVLHDAEMGPLTRTGVPEVYVISENKFDFTGGWQVLSYALNTTANPLITSDMSKDKWRVLYDSGRAFTNENGFNESGDPRRDYVNMRDLTAPYPKFDKTRICGGALVSGTVDGDYLILDSLNVNNPVPSLSWLLARPWLYFDAVNVTANGISRFPQGTKDEKNPDGNRVFVPLLTETVERYPLAKLKKLPAGYDVTKHDPYRVG